MKKFLFKIFIFINIILICNFVLYIYSNKVYFNKYEIKPSNNFETFLFADSHGAYIGEATNKYGVFNFSSPSESYVDIKRKLNFLISEGYNVKRIFLSVDNNMISKTREISNNNDKSIYYTSNYDYSDYFSYFKDKYLNYYFPILNTKIAILLRANIFNFFLNNLSSSNLINQKYKNNKSFDWSCMSKNSQITHSVKRKKNLFSSKPSDKLKNTLTEILLICKKNKIEIVAIKFPLSKSFLSQIHDIDYNSDSIILNFKLPLIDCQKLFINNDSYFEDQDHLNEIGSEEFSKKIFSCK